MSHAFNCGNSGKTDYGGEYLFTGCQKKYQVDPLFLPEEGNVLAPWVSIQFVNSTYPVGEFTGAGDVITVGNESATEANMPNAASIKSFEFGQTDGLAVRVTIQDQEGGSFEKFMNHVLKDWKCLENPANPMYMRFQFGWTKSECNKTFSSASNSPCYHAIVTSCETYFANGLFTFDLIGHDHPSLMLEGATEETYGGDGDKGMYLKDAVQEMLTNGPAPNVSSVRFCKQLPNGKCEEVGFAHEDGNEKKGPKSKWPCFAKNKLEVAKNWLEGWRSENDKGWIPTFNPEVEGGELVFSEDRMPKCHDEGDEYWNQYSKGTFIVNGGKRSSVIEFNPKIKWPWTMLRGAGGSVGSNRINALGTDGSKVPGKYCPKLKRQDTLGAGHPVQVPPSEASTAVHGARGQEEKDKSSDAAIRANSLVHSPIHADLVIVGDPSFRPLDLKTRNVSVIFINPYYVYEARPPVKHCEWLVGPACNGVLSNKAWIINSINHKIESGTYTTTLGLMLPAMGVEVSPDAHMGAWTKGWKPPNQC